MYFTGILRDKTQNSPPILKTKEEDTWLSNFTNKNLRRVTCIFLQSSESAMSLQLCFRGESHVETGIYANKMITFSEI